MTVVELLEELKIEHREAGTHLLFNVLPSTSACDFTNVINMDIPNTGRIATIRPAYFTVNQQPIKYKNDRS